jgi:hypothetical protein
MKTKGTKNLRKRGEKLVRKINRQEILPVS